jgi:hypothetical protein
VLAIPSVVVDVAVWAVAAAVVVDAAVVVPAVAVAPVVAAAVVDVVGMAVAAVVVVVAMAVTDHPCQHCHPLTDYYHSVLGWMVWNRATHTRQKTTRGARR